MLSTMLVKEAMSEKKTVTSFSSTFCFASTPAWRSNCTTGQGTYLPQDLMAFFMFSKMRWICRISAVPRSIVVVGSVVRPASCSCTMLCISSARSRSGFSRLRERKVRSFVRKTMPSRMMMITKTVTTTDITASCRTTREPLSSATVLVRLSSSSCETSASERSGNLRRTRSIRRKSEFRISSPMSSSLLRGVQVRPCEPSATMHRWPVGTSSLQ
mmetsp:Transcript_99746/g.321595  ORF Transcript_99746/g.321595 Transcript_99746/m.321595 type:complete len:215 (-) Transcript_99746:1532-2176(-)